MVRVRASLSQLPAYVPGRKLPGAVLLASNESPYGLLPGVAATLAEAAGGVSRYPDLHAASLVEALAAHHGVGPDRIAVGAGSSEVCGQLLHTVVGPGDEVVFGWRSFEAYPILTAVAGGTAVKVPLRDHALDLDAMVAAVTARTRLVFVRNPNNPTSTAVGARALTDFADRVPRDVLIVVDEAYREYADPAVVPDGLALLGDRPNVAVLRTFPKAYGLAGLRVGYCVAPPGIAAHVRRTPGAVQRQCPRAAGRGRRPRRGRGGRPAVRPDGRRTRPGHRCGRWATTCPTPSPTSSGCPSATTARTSPGIAPTGGSWSGRSRVRASG